MRNRSHANANRYISIIKTEQSTWTKDTGITAYTSNPRVIESKVTDATPNTKKTGVVYTQLDGVWQVTQKNEYQGDTATIYRQTQIIYTSYPTQRILGLPVQTSVYDGPGTTLLARTSISYDETGTFTDANNSTWNYLSATSGATQHDDTNYGGGFTQRANPTSVTQSSVVSGAVTATRVTARTS